MVPSSNRVKWLAYLVATVIYGLAFGKVWEKVLRDSLAYYLSQDATAVVFGLGLFVPMLILASASVTYYNKSRAERGQSIAELPYAKLWRGEENLFKALLGFCLINTILVTAAGVKLASNIGNVLSGIAFSIWATAFALLLSLHIVIAVGAWRSAARYRGARTVVLVSKVGVVSSFVVLILGLALSTKWSA